MTSQPDTLTGYLRQRADREPDQLLFRFLRADGSEAERYSCRGFTDGVAALAGALHEGLGAAYGDRVLLAYPPGLEMVRAFFACARLGVIPVPVMAPGAGNFTAAMQKLDAIAADCGAVAILSTAALQATVGARGWPTAQPRWVASDTLGACDDRGGSDDRGADAPDRPHHILFLQYTSGSTGAPRGVVVSHANVIANARATLDHVPVGVSWLPQYHDMGLIGYYLFPVVCGGTSHGMAPADFLRRPALWLQTISAVRATYTSAPDFGYDYCLRDGKIKEQDLRGVDLSSLRVMMNAAEPVRAATRERLIARFSRYGLNPTACVAAYGLAENTLAATHRGLTTLALDRDSFQRHAVRVMPDDAPAVTRLASCGRPLPGVELCIVDAARNSVLDEDQIGEVWLAGASTAQGYWRTSEPHAQAFGNRLGDSAAQWLRTGDLGFLHQGELYVCGRSKDVIIVRGVNYHPHDLEAAVASACAGIQASHVAAFQGHDEELVLLVEARRSALPDPAAVALALQSQAQVAADHVVLAASGAIVRTSSGKPARSATRDRYLADRINVLAEFRPGAVSLREHLALLAATCATGAETSLADLGLDSLMLTELALELERMLRERGGAGLAETLDLPLLQRLTLAQLNQLLQQLDADAPMAAIAVQLQQLRASFENDVLRRMRVDAQWLPAPGHDDGLPPATPNDVLLTGATGFFGPFLLSSLLRLTPCTYHVLVRAGDPKHALQRITDAFRDAGLWSPALAAQLAQRVQLICGDLALPYLGLTAPEWQRLARCTSAVIHNAAAVNYIANYEMLRPHNVEGTRTLLQFAHSARRKQFHLISTTFIFGWTAHALLSEHDNNDEMANLDFGYAQSKWVAEQLVRAAQARGLDARIYRPALISASRAGVGDRDDVAIRLLAFMIRHGVAVRASNQLSILAADVAADNIAAIIGSGAAEAPTMHVTADRYYNMADLTQLLSREHGYQFSYYEIPEFIAEMNRRCTRADPLFPLLDFFNRSADKIAAMQLKRYDNACYRAARARSGKGCADPSLSETAASLVRYLRALGWIAPPAY